MANKTVMKITVIGAGNVGMAIAADMSVKGHEVCLLKSSTILSEAYDRLLVNENRLWLKEKGSYSKAKIAKVATSLENVRKADVVFVTIQSTYHRKLFWEIAKYLDERQIVVIVCSYLSSYFIAQYCNSIPIIAETTGPYLEGRIELDDKPNEVVFRVGCRLSNCPLAVYNKSRAEETMGVLKSLYMGFNNCYSVIEGALLNPNMVLHTVGSIMSIPRIEFSGGVFCMYHEAYSRKNNGTLRIMLQLDEEKKQVLKRLGGRPIDIFVAGGFLGNPRESFYSYSQSSDRAIGPTSIRSRYIREDVSQGLVLLESIAKKIGADTPIASSLINIASVALGEDFRENGRTIQKLRAESYIERLSS